MLQIWDDSWSWEHALQWGILNQISQKHSRQRGCRNRRVHQVQTWMETFMTSLDFILSLFYLNCILISIIKLSFHCLSLWLPSPYCYTLERQKSCIHIGENRTFFLRVFGIFLDIILLFIFIEELPFAFWRSIYYSDREQWLWRKKHQPHLEPYETIHLN